MILYNQLFSVILLRLYNASSCSSCPKSLIESLSSSFLALQKFSENPSLEVIDSAFKLCCLNVCDFCFNPVLSTIHQCYLCKTSLYCCEKHRVQHRSLHSFLCKNLSNLISLSPQLILDDFLSSFTPALSVAPSSEVLESSRSLRSWVHSVNLRKPLREVSSDDEEEGKDDVILPITTSPKSIEQINRYSDVGKRLSDALSSQKRQFEKDMDYLTSLVQNKDSQIQKLMIDAQKSKTLIEEYVFLESIHSPEDFKKKEEERKKEVTEMKEKVSKIMIEQENLRLLIEEKDGIISDSQNKIMDLSSRNQRFIEEINQSKVDIDRLQSHVEYLSTLLDNRCRFYESKLMAFVDVDMTIDRRKFDATNQTVDVSVSDCSTQSTTIELKSVEIQANTVPQMISTATSIESIKMIDSATEILIKNRDQNIQTLKEKSKIDANISKSSKDSLYQFFSPSFLLSEAETSLLVVRQLIPPKKADNSLEKMLYLFDKCIPLVTKYRNEKSLEFWRVMILRCEYLQKASVLANLLKNSTSNRQKIMDSLQKLSQKWAKILENFKENRRKTVQTLYDSAKVTLLSLIDFNCQKSVKESQEFSDLQSLLYQNSIPNVENLATNIDLLSDLIDLNFSELSSFEKKKHLANILKYLLNDVIPLGQNSLEKSGPVVVPQTRPNSSTGTMKIPKLKLKNLLPEQRNSLTFVEDFNRESRHSTAQNSISNQSPRPSGRLSQFRPNYPTDTDLIVSPSFHQIQSNFQSFSQSQLKSLEKSDSLSPFYETISNFELPVIEPIPLSPRRTVNQVSSSIKNFDPNFETEATSPQAKSVKIPLWSQRQLVAPRCNSARSFSKNLDENLDENLENRRAVTSRSHYTPPSTPIAPLFGGNFGVTIDVPPNFRSKSRLEKKFPGRILNSNVGVNKTKILDENFTNSDSNDDVPLPIPPLNVPTVFIRKSKMSK
ncbi:hypothetical protein RCL1_000669 [Eukaryota sp. TZLM3-RCL]